KQTPRLRALLVCGEPHSVTELGIVLKQRVAPSGASASVVSGVRRGGQVAAVDGAAAGCVSDQQPISKQLRQQPDVRRFAASGAGPREHEQWLQQRGTLYLLVPDSRPIDLGQTEEVVVVFAFRIEVVKPVGHVQSLVLGLRLR